MQGVAGKVVRFAAETLVWTALCTGVWLLTLSSISAPEVVTAVLSSVPCGIVAVAARLAVQGHWPPRPAWARWLLPFPVAVVADGLRVLGLAAGVLVGRRIPAGEIQRQQLRRDRPLPRWHAHQALALTLVTATPGSVVLDIDEESGEMLTHALGSGRPQMEEVTAR